MATQLDLAKSQLYGFYHAKLGYSLVSLVESMGLSKREWQQIKQSENISQADRKEIDNYFKNRK